MSGTLSQQDRKILDTEYSRNAQRAIAILDRDLQRVNFVQFMTPRTIEEIVWCTYIDQTWRLHLTRDWARIVSSILQRIDSNLAWMA